MSLLLALTVAALAGVWVHPPLEGYAQLGFVHQQSSRMFLADTTLVPQTNEALLDQLSPVFEEGRYSANDANVYLELGVLRGVEVMANLPYRIAHNRWTFARGTYGDIVHRNQGFGDCTVGVRAGGSLEGVALSGFAQARAPLYDNSPEKLNMEVGNADFEDDRVPLGQGTLELDLGGGAGVGAKYGWALLDTSLRLRDRGYSSASLLRLQVGAKPHPRLAAWLGADAQLSLANGRASDDFLGPYGKGPLVVDGQSALQAQLGAAFDVIGRSGVTASVSRTLVGARFPRLTALSVGIYSNFERLLPGEGQ